MKYFLVLFLGLFLWNDVWSQWQIRKLPGNPSIRALDASESNNIWLSGTGGSIYKSNDGGETWVNTCPEEYRHLDFRGLAVLSEKVVLAMSAGDGSEGRAIVIKTEDGGRTWKEILRKEKAGIFFDTIKFRSPWTGYIIGDPIDDYPYLLKTIDAGETWFRVENLPPVKEGEASFAASNSCITIFGDNVWFNTQNRLFHSFDSGENWQVYNTLFMKGPSQGIFGIFALSNQKLIAVGGDYLPNDEPMLQYALTETGGKTWSIKEEYWIPGLTEAVSPLKNKNQLISVGLNGTAITHDGGKNWSFIDGEKFHVVKCFERFCVASGPEGRVGIMDLENP